MDGILTTSEASKDTNPTNSISQPPFAAPNTTLNVTKPKQIAPVVKPVHNVDAPDAVVMPSLSSVPE